MSFLWARLKSIKRTISLDYPLCDEINKPHHVSILFRHLLELQEVFEYIHSFVDSVYQTIVCDHIELSNGVKIKNGIYIRAFTDGLNDILKNIELHPHFLALAENFSDGIVKIHELKCSEDIITVVEYYNFACTELRHMINEIITNRLHGCQILDLVFRNVLNGHPPHLSELFKVLCSRVEVALLRQLQTWLVFGELDDPRHELFIVPGYLSDGESQSQDTYSGSNQSTCPMSSVPLSRTASEGFVLSQLSAAGGTLMLSQDCNYVLDANFVPVHMNYSLAKNILNVGCLLIILKKAPANVGKPCLEAGFFGIDEQELINRIKGLEFQYNRDFHALEEITNDIYETLNKRLLKLSVEVGGLWKELQALEDFMLMSRGDLISQFLQIACDWLSGDAVKVGDKFAFDHALETVSEDAKIDYRVYCERFKFVMPPRKKLRKDDKMLSVLQVNYKTPWPLHFLLSGDLIDHYNLIFMYLIKLRLVCLHLKKSIVHRMATIRCKRSAKSDNLAVDSVDTMLHSLLNLFTNLEEYTFVDVIQYRTGKMKERLSKESNLFIIKQELVNCLMDIKFSLFILHNDEKVHSDDHRSMGKALIQERISNLISACNSLCQSIESNSNSEVMGRALKQCKKCICLMFEALRVALSSYAITEVKALLHRLDYNGYYQKNISL